MVGKHILFNITRETSIHVGQESLTSGTVATSGACWARRRCAAGELGLGPVAESGTDVRLAASDEVVAIGARLCLPALICCCACPRWIGWFSLAMVE